MGIGPGGANDSAAYAGAAYVFVRNGMNQWPQQVYLKASNTDASDRFGTDVALSDDGNTLAVGARGEASNAMGIEGPQGDNSASGAGATYVFVRDGMDQWSQQAYVKASNTDGLDLFGFGVSLSTDGNTLAVGAWGEASNAIGVGGPEDDDSAGSTGATYVFVRDGATWSQRAYVKASENDAGDTFGYGVALSGDGNTLAVGAISESSNATGIGGDQTNDLAPSAGAVYLY
jgi:hypothetical protein